MQLTLRKKSILIGSVFAGIILIFFSGKIIETNQAGYYKVKQAAGTGTMSVRTKPGMYLQMFGSITPYSFSEMYYFSASDLDGGSGKESDPISVRFNDGGTADISGLIKFKLSNIKKYQLLLHQEFKSYEAVLRDLIRQTVAGALKQTAPLMKAEESYSTRRSDFIGLAELQVNEGIIETYSNEIKTKDADGNDFIIKEVIPLKDSLGHYVFKKVSPLKRYGIQITQFEIKDIDFDKTIDNLISKKKEAEQQKVVAKANAERAKQDAITELEQGKARIAKAKAEEDVSKIRAVTRAKKEFEVAQYNKKKAEEEAKARLIKQKAEADANKLLVSAGLTPLAKATIAKETAIGVAREMANIKFPAMMVIGGGGGKKTLDPFEAVGLKSYMDIAKELAKQK